MSFVKGFNKTAGIISGAAGLLGKGALKAGKFITRLGGGPLATLGTAIGAVAEGKETAEKFKQAYRPGQ